MTNEKLLEVIDKYEKGLSEVVAPKEWVPDNTFPESNQHRCAHLLWMLGKMRGFIASGETQKVQRWLRFIQGSLWGMGFFTIHRLREDNRST